MMNIRTEEYGIPSICLHNCAGQNKDTNSFNLVNEYNMLASFDCCVS